MKSLKKKSLSEKIDNIDEIIKIHYRKCPIKMDTVQLYADEMERNRENFEELQHEQIERIKPDIKKLQEQVNFLKLNLNERKNMSSDNSNTDNPQSDPPDDEKNKPKSLFLYNLKNNQKYILYFTGALIGGSLRVVIDQVQDVIPNNWWGIALLQILNLLLIFYAFIAPFVFGGKETIDELQTSNERIKKERKTQGEKISNLESTNNAILTVNNMQSQLLEENNITSLRFKTGITSTVVVS